MQLVQSIRKFFAAASAPAPSYEIVVASPRAVVSPVAIKDVPSDAPRFKREYTMQIDSRCRLTIVMQNRYYGGGRDGGGELRQPNGNWLLFDPDRIADKILDSALVPLIEKAVDRIYELDRAYMNTRPDEWTDDKGTRWKRVA